MTRSDAQRRHGYSAESRRRRDRDVDIPQRRFAATRRPLTWIVLGQIAATPRRRRRLRPRRRRYQVLRESANSAHPFKNFSTGCLETLKLPDVRDRLLRLWKDRYDPASMTACLVAARPLADLENLAVEAFGGIRRDADASPGPFEEEKMAREPLFSRTGVIHERVPAQRPSGIVFNNRWNAGAVESQGA